MTFYSSGIANSITFLRSQNLPVMGNQPFISINGLSGGAIPSAGVVGVFPVGGNTVPGTSQVSYPISIGAVDDNLIARRLLSDSTGNMRITGPRAWDQNAQPLQVKNAIGDVSGLGSTECLQLILSELKYLAYLMKELPLTLNTAQSFTDEEQSFINDPNLYN
jgi:hypothetical protein